MSHHNTTVHIWSEWPRCHREGLETVQWTTTHGENVEVITCFEVVILSHGVHVSLCTMSSGEAGTKTSHGTWRLDWMSSGAQEGGSVRLQRSKWSWVDCTASSLDGRGRKDWWCIVKSMYLVLCTYNIYRKPWFLNPVDATIFSQAVWVAFKATQTF